MVLVLHAKKPNILLTGSRDGMVIMWMENGN